jgi:hypothetical protein
MLMDIHVLKPPEYGKEKVVLVCCLTACMSVHMDGCAEREEYGQCLCTKFACYFE